MKAVSAESAAHDIFDDHLAPGAPARPVVRADLEFAAQEQSISVEVLRRTADLDVIVRL